MLRWLEGFEARRSGTYFSRLYDSVSGTPTFLAGEELNAASSQSWVITKVLDSQGTWTIGVRFRLLNSYSGGASNQAVILSNSSGEQLRFTFQPATVTTGQMKIEVRRGATVLASTGDLWVGRWLYFEFQAKIDPTTGTYEVRQDGVTLISGSGVNTANQAVANADRFTLSFAAGVPCQMDDIYVCDDTGGSLDDFLGPKRIFHRLPATEGATIEWTPSTGSDNTDCVDDPPTAPNDTDKVTAEDVDLVDLYNYDASAQLNSDTDVVAIQMTETVAMDTSGSRTVAPRVRSGMTEADGTSFLVNSTSLSSRSQVMVENPVDMTPWDKASLDAAQFGVHVIS